LYLPSKFIKSKFGASLLVILTIVVYLLLKGFVKDTFLYFYSNFLVPQSKLKNMIATLKAENLRLSLERKACKDIKKENERLRSLLKFKETHKLNIVPLRVISIMPSRFKRTIFAKTPSNSNFKEGFPVLDEKGFLIGRVSKVYSNFLEATLINDPDFFVTVRIRNNLGLLRGTLYGGLKVYFIDNGTEIKKGDKVFAVSYSLDREFLIGEIMKITQSPNSFFMDITVKPYSKFYPSRIVFVVQ